MTSLPFNWFDVALGVVILISAIGGLRAGFARVVVGLVATCFGLLAGFWCYRLVAEKIAPWVSSPHLADVFGFLIIFVGVLILGAAIAALLSHIFRWIGLSWFNHFLGGVAGFCRGILLIAILADILVAFAPSPMPNFLASSRVLPYATQMSGWLIELAPRQLKDSFIEQLQNLQRRWRTPSQAV